MSVRGGSKNWVPAGVGRPGKGRLIHVQIKRRAHAIRITASDNPRDIDYLLALEPSL